ncbi:MAG: c-type cytochrome [Firmicutes bacterium]|nr:c-type cytochrome [Bacillota bacterium]
MKQFARWGVALGLLVALPLGLAACGGGATNNATQNQTSTTQTQPSTPTQQTTPVPQQATPPTTQQQPASQQTTAKGDPAAGKQLYAQQCASCHGANAEGMTGPNLKDGTVIKNYPTQAQLSAYIKANMPLGNPTLTQKQADDVTAYIYQLNGK